MTCYKEILLLLLFYLFIIIILSFPLTIYVMENDCLQR